MEAQHPVKVAGAGSNPVRSTPEDDTAPKEVSVWEGLSTGHALFWKILDSALLGDDN
jgi:hypothetical protein